MKHGCLQLPCMGVGTTVSAELSGQSKQANGTVSKIGGAGAGFLSIAGTLLEGYLLQTPGHSKEVLFPMTDYIQMHTDCT